MLVSFLLWTAWNRAPAAEPPRFTIAAVVGGRFVEGAPLTWADDHVRLLSRDGQLWDFSPSGAGNYRQTSPDFKPYAAGELKERLEAEFGGRFEFQTTDHYVVGHPVGQGQVWPDRFEQMYAQFVEYFKVRGVSIRRPEFPLVATVFTDKDDFLHYCVEEGVALPQGAVGYYLPRTNRVAVLDIGAGKTTTSDWRHGAPTVVHEAAHQVAFNLGIHNRFVLPPRWLSEGMGLLFEARGVWDANDYPDQSHRINRARLRQFRQYLARRRPGAIQQLIASDIRFEQDTLAAFAESWALTFYLTETEPASYAHFLSKTASHAAFAPYPAPQRIADFTSTFGDNWTSLDAGFLKFMERL
jgi:hypothetical protein